mmetsp:Transcript_28654/g.66449  ORF Transcript_28654/g.66449 Transcript_28654/m.66449 type:complete len:910 (+) Transcript_28654:58-2787(+)
MLAAPPPPPPAGPPPAAPVPGYAVAAAYGQVAVASPIAQQYGYAGVVPAYTPAQYGQSMQAPAGQAAFSVAGCSNDPHTVSKIIAGVYVVHGENHGRHVFRKAEQVNSLEVLVYFWDDRDGPNNCGWWFGPVVGGDQVWAYNPERTASPPASGWRVPYDGPVDHGLVLTPAGYTQQAQCAGGAVSFMQQQGFYSEHQRQEELRREEEQRQMEQVAVVEARRVLQRLSLAIPDNFDALRTEVEAVLAQELPRCGSYAQLIREEAQQVMEQTLQRLEQMKERAEASRQLLNELSNMIDKADQDTARLKEAAEVLLSSSNRPQSQQEVSNANANSSEEASPASGDNNMTVEAASEHLTAVVAVSSECKASTHACLDFLMSHRGSVEEAAYYAADMKTNLLALHSRLQSCLRTINSTTMSARGAATRVSRKADALKLSNKQRAIFDKYDSDKDGMLNKQEAVAYGKGEFHFDAPPEVIDRLLQILAKGMPGVSFEKLHRLKTGLGIAREEVRCKAMKEKAAVRQREVAEKKAELEAQLKEAAASFEPLEVEVAALLTSCREIESLSMAEGTTLEKLASQVGAAKTSQETVVGKCREMREKLSGFDASVTMEELREWCHSEVRSLDYRLRTCEGRSEYIRTALLQADDYINRRQTEELQSICDGMLQRLKDHIASQKMSFDAFFAEMDKDQDGKVSELDFCSFLERIGAQSTNGSGWSTRSVKAVYADLDWTRSGAIGRDMLEHLVRNCYRVTKETVLQDSMAVKEGKLVRRLEIGEVVIVHEGPTLDESIGVMRVQCQTKRDALKGWATVRGNKENVFMMPCRTLGKVVKGGVQPSESKIASEGNKSLRELREGEAIEVIEWDVRDALTAVSGITWVRIRALADGVSGWVSEAAVDVPGEDVRNPPVDLHHAA